MTSDKVGNYILIDTNIFAEQTRLLRTSLGPTLLYFAKLRDAKIVLPDVVQGEARRYVANAVAGLNEQLSKVLRQTREFLGESVEMPTSAGDAVERAIDARFAELKRWIVPIQNSHDLLLKAADRVLKKTAPSHQHGKDSYKDSLIWESLLTLPSGSVVHFATQDKGFFDPEDGQLLHPTLVADAKQMGIAVLPYSTLEPLVKALQGDGPEIDEARASVVLNHSLAITVIQAMQRWQIVETGDEKYHIEPYLTDRAGVLYVEFKMDCPVVSTAVVNGDTYERAALRFEGNCYYDPHGTVDQFRVTREAIYSADGRELQASATAYLEGAASFGLRRQPYRWRKPLGVRN